MDHTTLDPESFDEAPDSATEAADANGTTEAAQHDATQHEAPAHDPAPAAADAASNEADAAAPASAEGDDLAGLEDPLADSELAAALDRIATLEDQLARANADHYNLNQEYGNYVRRTKEAIPGYKESGHVEVLEALIGVLDDIDAARQAGDLADGPFAAIATKLEDTLATRFGLSRYGAEGEDFDPTLHEALMARPNPEVEHPVIGQLLQPGYTMGERVLRVAKVLVDNPE
ncbi:nucleotide exchange factor GrpE [Schaalia sp. Marseille-Q2122]|uniref:nucleotide exchange factor GrpE n=1 Tax=Schaalia sp. Marseille-Q2122 TaxID=2736604 RepID=UPI00158B2C24|nr:nucleotide exchange factor GrpE [Schaalia sp. Marseille-Q2122]